MEPYCFEYVDPNLDERIFIEVVNTCMHHYTGEKMRYVREHWVTGIGKHAHCCYRFLNEADWQRRLEHQVAENA